MSRELNRPLPSNHESVIYAKVVLLGQGTVGKTSLVTRFIQDTFRDNREPTIGAAFFTETIELKSLTVKLNIWDTGGQERYRALAPLYYRNADGAVVVYDITSGTSLEEALTWINTLRQMEPKLTHIFLAANKLDLAKDHRAVPKEAGEHSAECDNLMFAEVSAKTGEGVKEIFKSLAEEIALQNKGRYQSQGKTLEDRTPGSKSCAC